MEYTELKRIFQELKRTSPREDLTAHIIFTEDSFTRPYPLLSRTYLVSSDNKGFWPNMFSNSIFAYCLNKNSDQGVRLDWYMADEGNAGGWKVQACYILERMRDADTIPDLARVQQPDGTVRYFFGGTSIQARETEDSGNLYVDVDPRADRQPRLCTKYRNAFDGEPDTPVHAEITFVPCPAAIPGENLPVLSGIRGERRRIMANQTIKAFYYGNTIPCERRMVRGSEATRIVKELSDTDKLLSQSLPPDFWPVLDRLVKAQGDLDGLVAETSYIDGFKTGARFIMEILDDARENLKPVTE